ncbi:hypothetical protein [Marivivens aquimaris]|uniref:hypothetical protein n=1 Tax=Marivivens aquimaris TaxID=2774876 RepID=UPI0018823862|nr:hypothetical protein [Marivivens aquimaris]
MKYTDTDVLALYIKYREADIGPFTREVGDFIAHSRRDRGATLDRTAYMFSQLAFFQKYQSNTRTELDFWGECPWWMKSWFLGKIEREPMSVLKRISGLNKKPLVREVKSWFNGSEAYSTQLVCKNPKLYYNLAQHFSRMISGESVFSSHEVRKELIKLLELESISRSELEPVIVATAVLLQSKSAEIVANFAANVRLSVHPTRTHPAVPPPGKTGKYVNILPDGNLKISVSTQNDTGDGLVNVALDLFDTGIDTEKYFSRSLVEIDEHGFPVLNLERKLAFERSAEQMVFPV